MPENTTATPFLANTARWTASARAKESEREDRLFNDPWASALAGEEGAEWLARQAGSPLGIAPMIVRTRFFDEFLQDAAHQQGIRQVLILAAGLDTRAFRLEWPGGTRLFELDQELVLQYKEQVLKADGAQPAYERRAIARDLIEPWSEALLSGGYDPQQPSAWLLEGFLFYLPNESITRILNQVSSLSATGSRLGFDIINSLTLTSPITKSWIEMQARLGAPWNGSLDDPEGFLGSRSWQASLTQPGAPDANFGRWTLPVFPVKMPSVPHNWYVTASKRS
jgi:methyltransferase (TIGR00027 family)